MPYHPPFKLTNRMTTLVANIAELIGMWKAVNRNTLVPESFPEYWRGFILSQTT